MPRQLNVTLADADYDKLTEVKGDRTWREAIMQEFGVGQEVEA